MASGFTVGWLSSEGLRWKAVRRYFRAAGLVPAHSSDVPVLSGAHEDSAETRALSRAHVARDVVANHDDLVGAEVHVFEGHVEELLTGLANHDGPALTGTLVGWDKKKRGRGHGSPNNPKIQNTGFV